MNKIKKNISVLKKQFTPVLLLCGLTMLFNSCLMEIESTERIQEGIDREITISISVPFPTLPTKALTVADEETIASIELLVFDSSGNYLYTSNADDITINSSDPDVRNFTAILKTGTVEILLLANCKDIINEFYPNGIDKGTSKTAIAEKLTVSIPDKWITDKTNGNYRHIPMWGEIGTVSITSSTTTLGSNPFDIHRMVARVDVTTSLPSTVDFKLTSVRLYHYNDMGQVIPDDTKFASGIPTIPTGATAAATTPIVYDGTTIANDAGGNPACIREIYLFEAVKGNRFTHPDHVCLVVGGEYKGIPGFYRIDFQQTTTQGKTYLDILRNHHYQVIITDVEDIGFPDPDEAHDAYPVNIHAQIIDWSDNNTDDISIGGNYILKLSTDELVFNPIGGTQVMYIYTNHPQGWKFILDNAPSWIKFDPVSGVQGNFTEVKVTAEENTDVNLRFYDPTLAVDDVRKDLMFAQRGTGDVELEVYVTPNPVLLGKYMITPVELAISTYPANQDLYFEYTGDIVWDATHGIPADGAYRPTVTMLPVNNNTTNLLTGYLTVYIKDDAGHIASCIVEFQQTTKITGFDVILEDKYPAPPGDYTFGVNSTVPWKIDYIADGSIWSSTLGSGTQPATSGLENQPFALTGNPLYADREIEVSFLAPDAGEYEIQTFVQEHIPPQLIVPTSIMLPSAGGQKETYSVVRTNANWTARSTTSTTETTWANTSLNAEIKTTSGAGIAYDLKDVDIEIETFDYTYVSNNRPPKAGILSSTMTVRITNYSPYTSSQVDHTKTFTVQRIVPPVIYLYSSLTYVYSYGPYGYETGEISQSNANTNPTDPKYLALIGSGEQELELRLYSNTSFTAWSNFDPTYKVTYNLSGNVMVTDAKVRLPIPANETGQNREVIIYVLPDGANAGEEFEFLFEQRGEKIKVSIVTPSLTSVIPTGGTDVTIKIEDPDGWLDASSDHRIVLAFVSDGELLFDYTGGYIALNGALNSTNNTLIETAGEYVLTLPPYKGNGTTTRDVQVIYALQNRPINTLTYYSILSTVHHTSTFKQDYKNHKLSDGYLIAKRNVRSTSPASIYTSATPNWVSALGIADSYLTSDFFNNNPTYNFLNYQTISGITHSCAEYHEEDNPTVTWRVPTWTEMQEMYANRLTIGGFHHGHNPNQIQRYWTVEELSATEAYYYMYTPSTSTESSKSSNTKTNTSLGTKVRCVSRQTYP